MGLISKEDWIQIRGSNVWQEFQAQLRESIASYASELVGRNEPNEARDMFVRGAIRAMVEILEWEPEYPKTEEEEA